MITCQECGCEMELKYTDYYDFDHYVCPQCGDEFLFPGWWYGEPDYLDYDDEYYD